MKHVIKALVISLLLALTVLSVRFSAEAASIEIRGKGQPRGVVTSDGEILYKCNPISDLDCTITIGDQ